MEKNVGGLDRIIRLVFGLGLMVAAATGSVGAWGWLGVVPVATAAFGICPAYLPFGFNTCLKTFR